MTRVLLVNPPSPERLGAPLLGQQYVAAALLDHGAEVRVIDAAARYFPGDADAIVAEAEAFDPDLVGFGLFTRWVWHAYRLAERFRGRFRLVVAGGAHATVRPDETLEHGFDAVLVGEAERSVVELVECLEGRRALDDVTGLRYRDAEGIVRAGRAPGFVEDLDGLALPQESQHLFDPAWYQPDGDTAIPGGILTSRGCPARCTFCANYVTGRGFRFRGSRHVVDEVSRYHDRFGVAFFPFWDDALTANRPRLFELCEALERGATFPLGWSAITRATMVTPDLLAAMRAAGCVAVNFGVESGDEEILRAIKKGITTRHVVQALEWAKDAGLTTACNFMIGFPQEQPRHVWNTLAFMDRIAPLTDTFSTLGVLVPFPGTPLYDDYHDRYGFTDWWLREEYAHYRPYPETADLAAFTRHYVDDANLELDFFHYGDAMVEAMRAVLRYKGEHNLRQMGLLHDPVFRPETVAVAPP